MNTLYATLALFAILATGSLAVSAFAQEFVDAVTVATDKEAYVDGDTVTVSGTVREKLSGYDVTLQVFAANGNLVTAQQLTVSEDNTFGIDLAAGGPLWKSAGTYTIKVLYGTATRTAETSFEFGGSGDGGTVKVPQFKLANPDDGSVGYYIKGGKILSITPDPTAKSLIVEIETTDDGQVKLILPRAVIDSKSGNDGKTGEDTPFFVLVDGEEVEFEEGDATDADRTITIPFENGASQIEIIGTWVIPEFGTIAVIVLAVAIVSIVAISRSRLSILPKY
ncbi:MAG: PEFG-CTERM sorting domain-containing protein [Nitrososphaeria archaeon]|nr:PEFG-CTERM sorting domain-containing protein [Nitrososphaeria archaeon]NDB89365.1 PEFG-CTERM sorting domain-containing protein [Nitrososphaerota archaeon]NDF28853.1 PEFG-CTERM sorting domain-containing protein [Nitrososphaeria archaeon]